MPPEQLPREPLTKSVFDRNKRPSKWHWINWAVHDILAAFVIIATAALVFDVLIKAGQ